jgi:ketosteroid isomerase-like protein
VPVTNVDADVALCRGYFAALSIRDWDAIGALCLPELIYSLSGTSPFSQEVRGRDAYLSMARAMFAPFDATPFNDVQVKPMAGAGLYLATYQVSFVRADGTTLDDSARVVFHIAGDKIAQIAVLLEDAQLDVLMREWAARSSP